MNDIVVSSRVRLARNYDDLPFPHKMTPEQGDACVVRTLEALRDVPESYRFIPMKNAGDMEKKALVEGHLISPDLLLRKEGAALIRSDGAVSIMINEEDHLRIQAFAPGENLQTAAENAFRVEEALTGRLNFAFDGQLGYLTACPTNIGTGMRASMMVHLPMLTMFKQMGKVNQVAAKLGLTIRGIYGEGSEARGNLYQISNQVTLGRTEREISEAVSAVARQLTEMERTFRERTLERDSVGLLDQMFRSYGLLCNARRMQEKEFMAHWSNLRLGAAMGKLPVATALCDELLTKGQSAQVQQAAGKPLTNREIDEKRSDLLRRALTGGE